MNRSAKIRRVIQVIAIMLALTLSFPQIPLAQKLGLGYEEVHAEPGEGFEIGEGGIINNIGSEKSGIYLETYIRGNNLIITPEYEVSEEDPEPEGTITYYYRLVDYTTGESDGDSAEFALLKENVSLSETITFEINSEDIGKTIIISFYYSGDNYYESFFSDDEEQSYETVLAPCNIISGPQVSAIGDDYILSFTRNEVLDELTTNPGYFFVLTPYESDSFSKLLPEALIELVNEESEENPEDSGIYFGSGIISWNESDGNEKNVKLEIDGSDLEEGFYVFQVVTSDENSYTRNISETGVTPEFHTPLSFTKDDLTASCTGNIVYQDTALTPEVTVAVNSESEDGVRKTFLSDWLAYTKVNNILSYSFKQIADYKSDTVTDSAKAESINAAGIYEIYVSGEYNDCSISDESLGEVTVSRAKVAPSGVNVSAPYDYENKIILLSGTVIEVEDYGIPTGTLKYEYSVDGETWIVIAENKGLGETNAYSWSIPEELETETFWIRATYSGDNNYKTAVSASYEKDFEAPVVEIYDVKREGDIYSFSIEVTNEAFTAPPVCFAILTEYNESGYEDTTIDKIAENSLIDSLRDNGDRTYTAFIDGSKFNPGIYVFQAVVIDESGNIGNILVTKPFFIKLELTDEDLSASADDLVYNGGEQNPSVTLTVNNDSEVLETLIAEKIEEDIENNYISISFIRIEDATGEPVSDEAAADTVKEAGVYEIYALSNDADIAIASVKLGEVIVEKAESAAPAENLDLIVSVSDSYEKYVVSVDVSKISLEEGQNLEFKFNTGDFGTDNIYYAEAGERVAVSVRIAATNNTEVSEPVSAEITTDECSAYPSMTQTGSFSTDTMTVEISANNVGDTIYYTLGDETEKNFVCTENSKTVSFDISKTTTVSAYVVENNKIKSGIVTTKYTYVEAPNKEPGFIVGISTDKSKYIVTVDVSNVTNAAGKTIEYSIDGTNYGPTKEFEVEAGNEINVYIRFAATEDLVESAPVSVKYKAPDASAIPTLNDSTDFTTNTMTVEISAQNTGDTIYYTVGDGEEKSYICDDKSKTVSFEITETTTVTAYVVETNKTKSGIVTATFNYVELQTAQKTPDNALSLKGGISVDKSKYIVTVDVSNVTNAAGKTIEYSIDGINYSSKKDFEVEAGQKINVYVRFAATEGLMASPAVIASYVAPAASAEPILTGSTNFSTDKMTVEISTSNIGDIIYYTVGDETEKTFVCTENDKTVSFDISGTTTVSAYAVEVDKIKSGIVTATYTYVDTQTTQEAPDKDPGLIEKVSADNSKYIVTVDVSNVTNAAGKTIEYSIDGTNYGPTKEFEVEAGKKINVYIRFAATDALLASAPVSVEYKAPAASAEPMLTGSTNFSTDKMTVEISASNIGNTIYYTVGKEAEKTFVCTENSKILSFEIAETTTISTYVVEENKVKSKVVSATYTKKENQTSPSGEGEGKPNETDPKDDQSEGDPGEVSGDPQVPTENKIEVEKLVIDIPATVKYDQSIDHPSGYFKDNKGVSTVQVIGDGNLLTLGTDYFLTYLKNESSIINGNNAGDVITVRATLIGKYSGSGSALFTITDYELTEDMISIESNRYIYTGDKIEPLVKVIDGSYELRLDEDYTVAYKNNIDSGYATATITGRGKYIGSIDIPFLIYVNGSMDPMTVQPIIDENTTVLYLVKGQKFTLPGTGWNTADKKILSVSKKGVVSAKKDGTTTIFRENPKKEITVYIVSPKIDKKIDLESGQTKKFTLNTEYGHLNVRWFSSAEDVATVSEDGTVYAVSEGSATITAYINGKAYNCKVKVSQKSIPEKRTLHINVGESKKITIKKKKVSLLADDTTIVECNGNKVKALKMGETKLTYYIDQAYTVEVFVEDIIIKNLTPSKKNKYTLSLNVGETKEIEFACLYGNYCFKSSKNECAYVDANGVIHALKSGTCKLTTKINGKTVTITVKVN